MRWRMVNITGDGIVQVVSEHVVIRTSLVEGAILRLAAEGVIDPEQHCRMDLEVVDVAGAEPGCGVGFVGAGRGGAGLVGVGGCGGNGVEAQCELLVDGVVGVDQDMGGIAVHAGESRELDGDTGLLGDFTHDRGGGGLADLDPTSG